jgi:serine/threonine protein kinase
MLSTENVVKLGDFGQAKYLPEGKDYWVLESSRTLPLRYMSTEALVQQRFSSKSDVWAFGVAMWEMITFVDLSLTLF